MKPPLQTALAFAALIFTSLSGWSQSNYTYQLDLNKTDQGMMVVKLTTPAIDQEAIDFFFPVAVPGYYDTGLQFGMMVTEFIAYDKWDMPLPVERVHSHQWRIREAQNLQRIEYKVRNMWKYRLQNSLFLPVENFFIEGRAFLLNPGGLFGYIEGMENQPFYIYIVRPKGLFACSGIKGMSTEGARDAFSFPSFRQLSDYPILYTDQRPASFQVANTTLEIGVFSEDGTMDPQQIKTIYEPILSKLGQYFEKALPAEKYAYLFFFYKGDVFARAALEHSNSSAWVWPEQWDTSLEESMKQAAVHQFLNIFAPLSIHSKEWLQFDFDDPSMSSHLWLYEGATEYLAYHAQVNQGLIPEKTFFWFVNDFLSAMKDFRSDVSLITVSRGIYGDMAGQYDNVKLKGAVANLLLDIELRSLSEGKYGLKHLVESLAARYGKHKAFKDEELFAVITEMTYPEVGEFLEAYISGAKPLPIDELFNKVGMEYDAGDNKVYHKPDATEEELALREVWLYGE